MAAEDRIEQVQEEIDRAREKAKAAGVLRDPEEPKYYESGELSDSDDQTITPPG